MQIPFNKAPLIETTRGYINETFENLHISGDGIFTRKCTEWLKAALDTKSVLLTTSGSHALDMAAYLCDLKSGDEVIMPSYTFSSTANAFLRGGAKIVFVDIRPDTMNLDEKQIEQAITEKTKVIVPVHYAGVSCEMDTIIEIAKQYEILIVEDAAQALKSSYKGRMLGNLSTYGCFSFHETKNFSMGEGGAIVIQDDAAFEKAEIIREKGTNRSKFFRGQIDKYSWVDWGSSYLPSELNAAYLWSQLEIADTILLDRIASWNRYYEGLKDLGQDGKGLLDLPCVPKDCTHNGHMFYIKVKEIDERAALIAFLKENGIIAPYHYVPLHSSQAGRKYETEFRGKDQYTTKESERLLRLPLYYGLKDFEIEYIVSKIYDFYLA